MGGGGRVSDGGLGISQVGGNGEHAGGVDKAPGRFAAAVEFERDDAPGPRLLVRRQAVPLGAGSKAMLAVVAAMVKIVPTTRTFSS